MAKTSLGAPAPAPASPFFAPASDQSTVSHLRVTAQLAMDKPDGTLILSVTSGNVGFGVVIFNLPGRPEYKPGDTLALEYPKGQNPLTDYSAIYHADQVSKVSQPQPKKVAPMSAITPFNFDSKTIRVVTDENGEPLFVGKDVCDALGYADHTNAMKQHCRGVVKRHPIIDSLGRTQEARVLMEPDVYRLIVKSELPEAQKFEAWFFEEVLPTIRKTGSYSMKGGAQPAQIVALQKPTREFKDYYGIAKLIGLDKNAAAIAANQAVIKLTGTDVLQLLEQKQMQADRQDTQWFTPTELGARLNISARAFNLLLAEAGLQMKRGEVWEVTDAGREFARLYDTGKKHGSGVPIQQIKWSPSVTDLLKTDAQKEAA